ncbi:hypothetical protein BGX21_005735, partial [Mortierella sp. AD011]
MLAANAHTPSVGPTAASPTFSLASPGASASPMPLHSVSTPGPGPSQRQEILCVFAIENSARMGPNFETLLMSYIEPILRHLRTPPIDAETNQPRPKDAPLVRCGLAIYGDYQPSSASTIDTRYFINDPITFLRELRQIKFEYGGVFRNAVTEGLVSALEMFDQYDELRSSDGGDPVRHLVLVADSSPHTTGCRCNSNERYDNYNVEDAVQELNKVNQPAVEIVDAMPKPSANHTVKLAGFQLPSAPSAVAPASSTPSVSDIQTVPVTSGTKRGSISGAEPMDLKRETSAGSPAATGNSPKLPGPSAKRTKVDDSHTPNAPTSTQDDGRKVSQDQSLKTGAEVQTSSTEAHSDLGVVQPKNTQTAQTVTPAQTQALDPQLGSQQQQILASKAHQLQQLAAQQISQQQQQLQRQLMLQQQQSLANHPSPSPAKSQAFGAT